MLTLVTRVSCSSTRTIWLRRTGWVTFGKRHLQWHKHGWFCWLRCIVRCVPSASRQALVARHQVGWSCFFDAPHCVPFFVGRPSLDCLEISCFAQCLVRQWIHVLRQLRFTLCFGPLYLTVTCSLSPEEYMIWIFWEMTSGIIQVFSHSLVRQWIHVGFSLFASGNISPFFYVLVDSGR